MASVETRAPGRWTPAARIGVRCDRLNDHPNTSARPSASTSRPALSRSWGERSVYEFIRAIPAGADIFERLERYARLDSSVVRAPSAEHATPRRRH
jgi:hypothetical protein